MKLVIPVKSYTRKFLEFYLGKEYVMRMDDPYGLHLFVLVQKSTSKGQREGQLGRYKDKFEVTCSMNRLTKNGYKGLTNLTTVYFNNFVEAVFKMEFNTLADIYHKSADKTIQMAVEEFMNKFGLGPADIDPMSLRREYLRFRKNEENLEKLGFRKVSAKIVA